MKNLFALILFCVFFSFSFISFEKSNKLTLINSYNLKEPGDSDEYDTPDYGVTDIANMFNERGFYKSNGFSFDENEIINDFNGNLVYNIPLYNYPLAGDLNFNMALTYNGSVGHQFMIGTTSQYNTNNQRYNMNAPEWIISLNGIAIQTLNFETNFLTTNSGNLTTIKDDSVRLLIPGYHFDGSLETIINEKYNRINILAGDGSLITLVHDSVDFEEDDDRYIGNYSYSGKDLYYRAKVSYLDPNELYTGYRRRKVELMQGDGTVCIFKEYKRDFADFPTSATVDAAKKPMILLLESMTDRFGHQITLNYSLTLQTYGRPLLLSIDASGYCQDNLFVSFEYGIIEGFQSQSYGLKIQHQSDVNGNYTLKYERPVAVVPNANDGRFNHRANVKEITNSLNQKTLIEYENYQRYFDNMYYPAANGKDFNITNMKRMVYYKNFLGKGTTYGYNGSSSSNSLTVSENGGSNTKLKSGSTFYHGYGRDEFYTNMIYMKTDSNNGVAKSKTDYTYPYTNQGSGTYDVDSLDLYSSTKSVSSLESGTLNSSASGNTVYKKYRVYPLYNYNSYYLEQPDIQGITKLMSDSTFNGVSFVNQYYYEKGNYRAEDLPGFTGSFLQNTKLNKTDGISRLWKYNYSYQNTNNYDKPYTSREETDPFNNKTLINYINIYEDNFICKLARNHLTDPEYDIICFYKILMDSLQLRKDSSNHKLSKKLFEYISRNDSSIGYYGQLRREKNFNNYDTNNYIQTEYEYYRNDTSSSYIYDDNIYPYKNGNLKTITKPGGEQEKYFYHIVNVSELYGGDINSDAPPFRRHKFKMKFNNGTVKDTNATIWDTRFPIRTDNYKINGGSVDTLSINYKSYNLAGNPTRTFGRDSYVTEFTYKPTHRISSITLPGDFSIIPDSVGLIIDTNYIYTELDLVSNGWGNYNTVDQKVYYSDAGNYSYLSECDNFKMLLNNTNSKYAFMKLNTPSQLYNFQKIDSAILKFSPISFSASYDGDNISNIDFNTKVKGVTYLSNSINSESCGSQSTYIYQPAQITTTNTEIELDTINNNCYYCCFRVQKFDIKNLIDTIVTNQWPLLGLTLNSYYNGPRTDLSLQSFYLNFTNCLESQNGNEDYWYELYRPVLYIYGILDQSDTLRYPIVKGGTIKYIYDDPNKKIDVISVRNTLNNDYSKIEYSIDGFGNIKQKDIYTDAENSNSYKYKFNYMNLPARNFDALDDSTMFSYDGMGRLKKTKNADTSSTINTYSYFNGISNYYFGTLSGLIEAQSFKDEEGHDFYKYFDAVGNLVREVKTLDNSLPVEDYPLNYLITDYKYDSLYRVIKVKTPNGKIIYYSYDGYGRQSKRITPDAGQTVYIYNELSNLTYTQDANQKIVNTQKYTFRNYDGLNRLTGIGEEIFEIDAPSDGSQNNNSSSGTYLTVNVYDTISNSTVNSLFSTFPGYSPQFTKDNLAATAYRTKASDSWNFKYYSYDERKRVIKMWNIISGFDTLITEYKYNSQDQITIYSHTGPEDTKTYRNTYDYAGRLSKVDYYIGVPDIIEPEYINIAEYSYNENSQVNSQRFNNNSLENIFTYNNRNWVTDIRNTDNYFRSENSYFKNGNVKTQNLSGDYSRNMAENNDLSFNYTYDKSNRLLSSYTSGNIYNLTNTYDKDGNIITLDRKGRTGNSIDSFAYDYYSGTNKLLRIRDGKEQFFYDANGNMTEDDLNKNINIKYNYRNLITQLQHTEITSTDTNIYLTYYGYDEAGNRILKKVYKSVTNTEVSDTLNEGDMNISNGWIQHNAGIYSRDVSGKELAIYKNGDILEYPVYGLDMIGKIKNDEMYYYFKDHLGSVRATVNSSGEVVSAQDYDAWGYLLQDRTFDSEDSKFKFTGKERDSESDYDYFGARYYDSRIGRWEQIDPLMEKHLDFSPYVYVIDNPLYFYDPDGKDNNPAMNRPWSEPAGNIPTTLSSTQLNISATAAKIAISQVANIILSQILEFGRSKPSIFVITKTGENELVQPITEIEIISDPNVYSKGGRKQIWPDQYIGDKPKNIKDIDWSKGDQELADNITGKDVTRGPDTPNNLIKKWFNDHRPKNKTKNINSKKRDDPNEK